LSGPTTSPPTAHRPSRTAPGPSGRQAVRELVASRADQIGWTERARDRYGEVFALRLPRVLPGAPPQVLYACEPAAVREILTDGERFTKAAPVYEELASALGDGLLTSEGARWRAQRRTLQPLFTRKHVTRYADPFLAAIHDVVDGWRPGTTVDLAHEMERVTLGSVSRALFGTDATGDIAPIVTATDTMSRITVERGTAPVRLPRWLPTRQNRTYARVRRDLHARVQAIVSAHDDTAGGDDLVAHLHAATDPEVQQMPYPQLDTDGPLADAVLLSDPDQDIANSAVPSQLVTSP
jgi:cytochrome P450